MDAGRSTVFPHFTVVKTAKRNEEALIAAMNISKSKQTRWYHCLFCHSFIWRFFFPSPTSLLGSLARVYSRSLAFLWEFE